MMPLHRTLGGTLSDTFILKGRLCFTVDLIYKPSYDTRDINEFMEMLKGRSVELTLKEVPAHVQ
jgi:hypothetical protein